MPAGELASTGGARGMLRGLAHIELDLDSDPGPWPRADEDTSAHSQLGCSGLRVSPHPSCQNGADLVTSGTGPCSKRIGAVGPPSRDFCVRWCCQVVTSQDPGRSECQGPAPGSHNKGSSPLLSCVPGFGSCPAAPTARRSGRVSASHTHLAWPHQSPHWPHHLGTQIFSTLCASPSQGP